MARTASRTTPNLGSQPLRGADFERAHSSVVLGEDVRDRRRGFTIVELLIVVVVIAVLAAITIVAYNGINNRAKASAASSAAQQAAKKVTAYAVTNTEQYPAALSDAGVSDSGSTSYQYRVDNSTSPRTFCLTATSQNVSFFVSNASTSATAGACAGHGLDGAAPITNLSRSPVPTATFSSQGWLTSFAGATLQSGGPQGRSYLRTTSSTVASGSTLGIVQGTSSSTGAAVNVGESYTASAWVRVSDVSERANLRMRWKTSANGTISDLTSSASANDGGWYRLTVSGTAPSGAAYVEIGMLNLDGGVNPGVSIDGTGILVTAGSASYSFADGNTPSWIWNGTADASTSTGPAL